MSKYDCLDEEIEEVSDEGHVAIQHRKAAAVLAESPSPIGVLEVPVVAIGFVREAVLAARERGPGPVRRYRRLVF